MENTILENERQLHEHDRIDKLDKEVKQAKEDEKKVRESLNESTFIIDAIKDFEAKEAELQAEKVQGLFETLSIKLSDLVKSTGEMKPTFEIKMDDKEYVKLSTAEKILAGLELRNVLSQESGLVAPCFVDNAESITKFKQPIGQLITATVVGGKKLEVVNEWIHENVYRSFIRRIETHEKGLKNSEWDFKRENSTALFKRHFYKN